LLKLIIHILLNTLWSLVVVGGVLIALAVVALVVCFKALLL
jgi:hypothetical protein